MASTLSKAFEEARKSKWISADLEEAWIAEDVLTNLPASTPNMELDEHGQLHVQARKARTDHKGTVITTPEDGSHEA